MSSKASDVPGQLLEPPHNVEEMLEIFEAHRLNISGLVALSVRRTAWGSSTATSSCTGSTTTGRGSRRRTRRTRRSCGPSVTSAGRTAGWNSWTRPRRRCSTTSTTATPAGQRTAARPAGLRPGAAHRKPDAPPRSTRRSLGQSSGSAASWSSPARRRDHTKAVRRVQLVKIHTSISEPGGACVTRVYTKRTALCSVCRHVLERRIKYPFDLGVLISVLYMFVPSYVLLNPFHVLKHGVCSARS